MMSERQAGLRAMLGCAGMLGIGIAAFLALGALLELVFPKQPGPSISADECLRRHLILAEGRASFLDRSRQRQLKLRCERKPVTFEKEADRIGWEFVLNSPLSQQEARFQAYVAAEGKY